MRPCCVDEPLALTRVRALSPTALAGPSGEMVDAVDSKSIVERRAGSSPAWGTN